MTRQFVAMYNIFKGRFTKDSFSYISLKGTISHYLFRILGTGLLMLLEHGRRARANISSSSSTIIIFCWKENEKVVKERPCIWNGVFYLFLSYLNLLRKLFLIEPYWRGACVKKYDQDTAMLKARPCTNLSRVEPNCIHGPSRLVKLLTSFLSFCLRVTGNSQSDSFRRITILSREVCCFMKAKQHVSMMSHFSEKTLDKKVRNLIVSWSRERGFLVLVAISASSLFRDSMKSVPIGLFQKVVFVFLEDVCCFKTNMSHTRHLSRTLSRGICASCW